MSVIQRRSLAPVLTLGLLGLMVALSVPLASASLDYHRVVPTVGPSTET